MLDDYKTEQNIFYNIVNNELKNNKLSHAYLILKNDNVFAMPIILSFVKAIICPSHYTNRDKCEDCNICKRIDDNNYMELKIIRNDGMWIKKDQMIDLQEEFSKKAIEGSKKIYIIDDCEKMNTYTANSILKFLEEPEENIIAILLTNNINQVLKTVVSRCQILSLKKNQISFSNSLEEYHYIFKDFTSNIGDNINDYEEIVEATIEFMSFLEDNRYDTIIYAKKLWHNKFKERKDSVIAFNLIIILYYQALKYKYNLNVNYLNKYMDFIKKISKQNESTLIKKIQIFIEFNSLIKYNLNMNLLIDNLIINVGGLE